MEAFWDAYQLTLCVPGGYQAGNMNIEAISWNGQIFAHFMKWSVS